MTLTLHPNFSATGSSIFKFLSTDHDMSYTSPYIFSSNTQLYINAAADESCSNVSIISLQMFSLSSYARNNGF